MDTGASQRKHCGEISWTNIAPAEGTSDTGLTVLDAECTCSVSGDIGIDALS